MINRMFRNSATYVGLLTGAFAPAVISHDNMMLFSGLGFLGAVIICRICYILEQIYKKLEKTG